MIAEILNAELINSRASGRTLMRMRAIVDNDISYLFVGTVHHADKIAKWCGIQPDEFNCWELDELKGKLIPVEPTTFRGHDLWQISGRIYWKDLSE